MPTNETPTIVAYDVSEMIELCPPFSLFNFSEFIVKLLFDAKFSLDNHDDLDDYGLEFIPDPWGTSLQCYVVSDLNLWRRTLASLQMFADHCWDTRPDPDKPFDVWSITNLCNDLAEFDPPLAEASAD